VEHLALIPVERIKMSTRGGWIVEPEKHNFFAAVKYRSGVSGYFSGYSGKSGESGKMSGYSGLSETNQIRHKLNLLKCKFMKIDYALR
jgi:hypothetical protein